MHGVMLEKSEEMASPSLGGDARRFRAFANARF